MSANTKRTGGYTKEWLLRRLAQGGPTEPNVTSTLVDYEDLHEDASDYEQAHVTERSDAEHL